jgi:hypothetical protein
MRFGKLFEDVFFPDYIRAARKQHTPLVKRLLLHLEALNQLLGSGLASRKSHGTGINLMDGAQRDKQRGEQQQGRKPRPNEQKPLEKAGANSSSGFHPYEFFIKDCSVSSLILGIEVTD